MALFKSGNPALSKQTFKDIPLFNEEESVMTLQGTVNKTVFLLLLVFIPAICLWVVYKSTGTIEPVLPYFIIGTIAAFILSIIIAFNKTFSPYLAVIYAICEGLSIGGLSVLFENNFPGIALQALLLTFGIFSVLLIIYKAGFIKPSENFKLIVASATGGLMLYYLINLGLHFFNINLPFIHENTTGGIIFSVFVIILAAMNLVVDFDFIEDGAAKRAPKYMEWYCAFGLMVTIIWLYIEILRLLAKARRR